MSADFGDGSNISKIGADVNGSELHLIGLGAGVANTVSGRQNPCRTYDAAAASVSAGGRVAQGHGERKFTVNGIRTIHDSDVLVVKGWGG